MSRHLSICGSLKQAVDLSAGELDRLPEEGQIRDLNRLFPKRNGDGIRLSLLLERFPPSDDVTHLTLHARHDGFSASLPLNLVREVGVIQYQQDGQPLSEEQGGPFRFLIEQAAPCKTDELDACANVKYLDEIEYSVGKGKDTR
ncbi:Oxidoreductase molybdopterin binding domain protein [Polystyrenella longa]|uniref:Oxidoreductase molybdopterin binding domain protein n=1 Tax=Polystyrenella longa TaxID=2528007 RepID=A0A518CSJ3_9PLAN|nr:molybdopterin-dependent oxidoreductase [Polystyrenella longa]QDU82209.1 Oxidoreductase molybdopterin binding domain protein [Polystyrenella longa]